MTDLDAFRLAARLFYPQLAIDPDETVVLDNDGDAFVRVGQYRHGNGSRLYVFVTREEMQEAKRGPA